MKFVISEENIHKLNQVKDQKHYKIQIGAKKLSYSKVQLIFLSLNALSHFKQSDQSFLIYLPEKSQQFENFSLQTIIGCFEQLNSLFHHTTELLLTESNTPIFLYLADVLGNPFLLLKCKEVSSTQNQIFKLSSEQLAFLPKNKLKSFNNFSLKIKKNTV
jgi:hypothetical protein